MKSDRNGKNVFIEAGLRLFKAYPLLLLAAVIAALWFYSLGKLCVFTVYSGGSGCAVEPARNSGHDDLASLREALALFRQRESVSGRFLKLAEASEGSPFHAVIKPTAAKYIPEQAPPLFCVRAVAVGAKSKSALIDLDGDCGKLVRENEQLLGGTIQVIRINSDGVTWTWDSEEFFSPVKD